jgi:hypothetical protein
VGTVPCARQRKTELAMGDISFLLSMYFTCQHLSTLVSTVSQGFCPRNMGTWQVSERENVANFLDMMKAPTVVCFCLCNAVRHSCFKKQAPCPHFVLLCVCVVEICVMYLRIFVIPGFECNFDFLYFVLRGCK